eukprot:3466478-Pyramimonas_sp.AAC.1
MDGGPERGRSSSSERLAISRATCRVRRGVSSLQCHCTATPLSTMTTLVSSPVQADQTSI